MATIGTFRKSATGDEYTGAVATLELQRNVRIVPETRVTGENAPSHRVYAGRVEIGAAWPKVSQDGRPFLSLKLDDPSFSATIFASLLDDEDSADGYSLIWSRPQRQTSGDN
ncbi:DUF736 domain-containing protein [Paenirhodobacter populi]|uniref:DUF736 domain-containing protein n=2 Tax=Paenirhodobacter populi TaxID=2306993 RepID=A0A443K0S8_9RHOB|nr:DUF736 domain-containing protein [Sinirhodobacter populi]RWR16540.1 DUF736 domain-containing protein [Sinirhodobacter populi]RWR26372.1 DUF736 domain-containing protein [Sinirhodobacter populi]